MAKVQILQSISGEHFSWLPGHVIDMPADEAEKWADNVRGVLVDDATTAHQTYDPASLPIAEVLIPGDPADDQAAPTDAGADTTAPADPGADGSTPADPGDDSVPATPVAVPAGNASKAAWVEYALTQGATEAELDALTRNEIAAKYAPAGA